jgi:hypothetical protein
VAVYVWTIGVIFLAAWVGVVLVAWHDRSLVAGVFALIMLMGYAWFGYQLLVASRNHID